MQERGRRDQRQHLGRALEREDGQGRRDPALRARALRLRLHRHRGRHQAPLGARRDAARGSHADSGWLPHRLHGGCGRDAARARGGARDRGRLGRLLLSPRRAIPYAWVIVGTLSWTETITWGIIYYGFAVFLTPMERE